MSDKTTEAADTILNELTKRSETAFEFNSQLQLPS